MVRKRGQKSVSRRLRVLILFVCIGGILACANLRFSQVNPAARDFHPQSVAVFAADVGPCAEAKGLVEKEIATALRDKKWFSRVIDSEEINGQMAANGELQAAITEYLSKLKMLNYSDPYLSRKISEHIKAEAFLMVTVDAWQYTVEQDKKVAKVGLWLRLYEGVTGQLMWKAGHQRTESYMLLKPELSAVARTLAEAMLGHMPR